MTVKNQPGTPLPWRKAEPREVGGNSAYASLLICAQDGSSIAVFSHGGPNPDPLKEVQDAAYALHSSDAYRRLVPALRNLLRRIDAGDLKRAHEDFSVDKEIADAKLLIRELGEDGP